MKRRKSDSVVARKTAAKPASVNPFEVRLNRKKHDILGQKTKSDRGLPGVSRSKAIKKVSLRTRAQSNYVRSLCKRSSTTCSAHHSVTSTALLLLSAAKADTVERVQGVP